LCSLLSRYTDMEMGAGSGGSKDSEQDAKATRETSAVERHGNADHGIWRSGRSSPRHPLGGTRMKPRAHARGSLLTVILRVMNSFRYYFFLVLHVVLLAA